MGSKSVTISRPRGEPEKIIAGCGWLGIPDAMAAVAMNLRFFAARRPGTPLRVLSLIAISTVLRSRGIVMPPQQRRAVIEAMDLGARLNDRFDGDACDAEELRESVACFKKSAHREVVWNYAKRLRRLVRTRPGIAESAVAVRRYREAVNRVSLAVLWALASQRNLADAELDIEREPDLKLLFQMVMQFQLIDDVLDARQDRCRSLPSFATGQGVTTTSLDELVADYADEKPIRFDRNFCLRVALGMIAASARAVIAIRAGGGFPIPPRV
jgi:hypothetical protein